MITQFIYLALAIVLLCPFAPAQWVQTNSPANVYCFTISGTNVFAGTDDGVFLSSNNGTSWTAANSGLADTLVLSLAATGANLFAGSASGGVFFSTSNGTSWTVANSGLPKTTVYSLAVSGTNLFAGAENGVFLSTNIGTSWTEVDSGLTDTYVNCLSVSGANLFAGTMGGGVFLSTNNGTTWTAVNTGLTGGVYSLAVSGKNLFAGGSDGVFLSTNNGTSWTAVNNGLTDHYLKALAMSSANLFAGTNAGVFLSTNNGASWTAVNEGLMWTGGSGTLEVSGANLLLGTCFRGIWRRALSEMITMVNVVSGDVPTIFRLEQNYPNPFNPNSEIRYQISEFRIVKLSVYDLLGREVSVLVNEQKAPGSYSVTFDGTGLSSGVYVYRLTAGDFVATKRLLLLK